MKLMMFAHSGSLNRGCEAIVRSSTNIIRSNIKDCEIHLASLRPNTDEPLKLVDKVVDGRSIEINRKSYQYTIAAIMKKFFKSESYAIRVMQKNTIEAVGNVDICLSIGGDAYCYGEQPWMYEIDSYAKKSKKKLVLWGTSIGEEDLSPTKLRDLSNFDLIIARESLTYSNLKKNGIEKVKLCADPAFTMEKEELPLPKGWKKDKVIGINFSPLVARKSPNGEKAVRDLIKHILKTTNLTIALTPHVTEEGNNDFEFLKRYYKMFKETGRVIMLPDNLTAPQYKGYIARMKYFIGARTHATIAAYSSFVPTLVLGYSIKSKGIAKDLFGKEKLVVDVNEIDTSTLIEKFEELKRDEVKIKEELKAVVPMMQKKAHMAGQYLKELLNA